MGKRSAESLFFAKKAISAEQRQQIAECTPSKFYLQFRKTPPAAQEQEPEWSPGSRTRREDRWRPESSYRAARPTPLDHAALKRRVHKDTMYERTEVCAQKAEAEDRWALKVLQDLLGCTRTKGKPQATGPGRGADG